MDDKAREQNRARQARFRERHRKIHRTETIYELVEEIHKLRAEVERLKAQAITPDNNANRNGSESKVRTVTQTKRNADEGKELPNWLDLKTWNAYIEMRVKKHAPATDHAKDLTIRELEKFKAMGQDPNKILEQSIMRGYTGVFPLKEDGSNGQNGIGGRYSKPSQRRLIPRDQYTRPEDL